MSDVLELDAAVIGGGVIGLALARALSLAGREVTLLEADSRLGNHTSSRNSEVIHAGSIIPKARSRRVCVSPENRCFTSIALRAEFRTATSAS